MSAVAGWTEVATGSGPTTGHELDQISALSCDPFYELAWAGTKEGRIISFANGGLQRCTMFKAHEGEVRQILIRHDGILSIGPDSVGFTTRGGLPHLRLKGPSIHDLNTACHTGTGEKYLLAGQQQTCLVFEANRGKIVKEFMVDNPIFLMKRSRLLCCASASGVIHLRDPKTLATEHTIPAHSGGIYDMDVQGNLLVTCGYSERNGRMFVEKMVKVFDLRTLRPLPPVSFGPGPFSVRLHPRLTSIAAVVSQSGVYQLTEVGGLMNVPSMLYSQVGLLQGQTCTAFDLSLSGEVMVFGDSLGFVHQCTDRDTPVMNAYMRPPELAPPLIIPDFDIDDKTPLSVVGMPYYEEKLLSAWPANQTYVIGQPTPPLDPEVLGSIKQKDFVGYSPNPGTARRNQVWKKTKGPERPKFRSEQERDQHHHHEGSSKNKPAAQASVAKVNAPPSAYQRVEIEYSRLGVEDFDFGFYNKTPFTGLETQLAYSYCNSMLQVLYFLPPIRQLMIFMSSLHFPEPTLSCELGFLFKMMDSSKGQNCHAGNFFKIYGSLPQVTALGLHEPENPTVDISYGMIIQIFNRFILEHLQLEMSKSLQHFPLILRTQSPVVRPSITAHFEDLVKRQLAAANDISGSPATVTSPPPGNNPTTTTTTDKEREVKTRSPPPPGPHHGSSSPSHELRAMPANPHLLTSALTPIQQLFGMRVATSDTCSQCKTQGVRDAFPCVIDLLTTKKVKEIKGSAIAPAAPLAGPGQADQPAPQPPCQPVVTFAQVLETSINRESHPKAWCGTCQKYQFTTHKKSAQSLPNILSLNCGAITEEDMSLWSGDKLPETFQVFEEEAPYTPWVPPWLHMWIEEGEGGSSNNNNLVIEEIRDPAVALSTFGQMVEEEKGRRERQAKQPPVSQQGKTLDESLENRRVLYELVAVVAEIHNAKEPPHLVSHIRIPEFYHESIVRMAHKGARRSSWYLFNDFSVTPISEQKVLYFHPAWKIPVILLYATVELEDRVDASFLPTQMDLSLLLMETTLPRLNAFYLPPKKIPLNQNEIPRRGTLCALDAEFVSTKEEETETRADGTKRVIKPVQLTLARVSVIRGWGPREGTAFIDDYIHCKEPIIDYLTKFSGINPGDLDPALSPHPLTTRKASYSKLRILCDLGCIFVGHGLRQDFRIINIFVPSEQIIDTVEIYRLKGHRKISLRFLAWYILNKDVQRDTHDSVEDAKTALELYKRSLDLKRRGIFDKTLEELYEYGRNHGWEIGGVH